MLVRFDTLCYCNYRISYFIVNRKGVTCGTIAFRSEVWMVSLVIRGVEKICHVCVFVLDKRR
jgi:hypothetical protein